MTGIKIIKIFLASSSELKDDREQFEIFINRKNKEYIKQRVFLELVIWEDFLDAMSATRLQNEYNKAITDCDVFVSLFKTKVGRYTEEEFTQAFKTFQNNKRPLIYTYFQDSQINVNQVNLEDLMSLKNFKDKLRQLEHFYTIYKNTDDLKHRFSEQLNKFLPKLADNLRSIPISNRSQSDEIVKLRQELGDTERSHKSQIKEKDSEITRLQRQIEQLKPDPKPTPKDKVKLKTEQGVDYTKYTKLRDLLEAGKWKDADEETAQVMLKTASRQDNESLRESDIDNFPSVDLRTINQLWLYYSEEKFGFSVQKEIYESLRGTRQYNSLVWNSFADRIGWKKGENWLNYDKLTFNLDEAPKAHLPALARFGDFLGLEEWRRSLLSRKDL